VDWTRRPRSVSRSASSPAARTAPQAIGAGRPLRTDGVRCVPPTSFRATPLGASGAERVILWGITPRRMGARRQEGHHDCAALAGHRFRARGILGEGDAHRPIPLTVACPWLAMEVILSYEWFTRVWLHDAQNGRSVHQGGFPEPTFGSDRRRCLQHVESSTAMLPCRWRRLAPGTTPAWPTWLSGGIWPTSRATSLALLPGSPAPESSLKRGCHATGGSWRPTSLPPVSFPMIPAAQLLG
jgi:hypothetical protein